MGEGHYQLDGKARKILAYMIGTDTAKAYLNLCGYAFAINLNV